MDVHQDADVGVPHGVDHLTGHGLGEERVICRGDKHTFPGALQQHATFSPPDKRNTPPFNKLSNVTNHCYVNLSAGDLKSIMGF